MALGAITVHAHDNAFVAFHALLIFVGGFLDLALHIAGFYGPQHAAQRIDALDAGARARFNLIGQMLDGVGAANRVYRVGHSAFVSQNLLGAKGEPGGLLRRQRQRFIERVGVQRLASAEHGCERLDGYAHNIIFRLLCRERRAGGLRMEAQHHRARVASAKAVAH